MNTHIPNNSILFNYDTINSSNLTKISSETKNPFFSYLTDYSNKKETIVNTTNTQYEPLINRSISNEKAIERSNKIQEFFENDYEEFQAAQLECVKNKDNPAYEPPEKYAKYLTKREDVRLMNVIIDGKNVPLSLEEFELHYKLHKTKDIELNESAQTYREWNYQRSIKTSENKYEDAPEFEAFVSKWMDKGLTEEEALSRAAIYCLTGLLDYGKQRAIVIGDLPFGDKKEHGLHLINNPILKEALIEIFDSMDYSDMNRLNMNLFGLSTAPDLNPENKQTLSFQNILDNYALLPASNISDDFVFDGDINITEDMEHNHKNFILDIINSYFEYRIDELNNRKQEKYAHEESIDESINTIQKIIDNFEKKVNKSNENYLENKSQLERQTKNHRPNPLQNYT